MTSSDSPDSLVLLTGLPRSGTTLLASMFAVHPDFCAVYEPWNAGTLNGSQDALIELLSVREGLPSLRGKHLLLKETSDNLDYVDYITLLAERTHATKRCIVMLRDPIETFVSTVDRQNEWWNRPTVICEQELADWANKSILAFERMHALAKALSGQIVSMHSLVKSPRETLEKIMNYVGVQSDPRQLEYERHLSVDRVRGDLNVARCPSPIGSKTSSGREPKRALVVSLLNTLPQAPIFWALREAHELVVASGGTIPARGMASLLQGQIDADADRGQTYR